VAFEENIEQQYGRNSDGAEGGEAHRALREKEREKEGDKT
jgi:hypothetical protein